MNQVVYCPLLGTIGSSGVEKSIRIWSEYPQEPFNGAVIKRSDENSGKKSTGQSSQDPMGDYERIIFDDSRNVSQIYDEDEEMIAFFDAIHSQNTNTSQNNGLDVDEETIGYCLKIR